MLKLETQASALQWDISHEQKERETIEHTLNSPLNVSLKPRVAKLAAASPPSSPRLSTSNRALSPPRSLGPKSPAAKSPAKASASPTLATLKELLHMPAPEPEQFEFYTPPKSPKQPKSPKPKSPRRSLRSLWSALDGQPQTTLPSVSKKVNISAQKVRLIRRCCDM